MEEIPNNIDADHISCELQQHVVFAHVSVHLWRGRFKIRNPVIQVHDAAVDKSLIGDTHWTLMPEIWHKKFGKIENELRSIISSASPRFSIPGVYVLPRKRTAELFRKVDVCVQEKFQPLVKQFVDSWESTVADNLARAENDSQRQEVKRFLTDNCKKLGERFYVDKHVIPVAGRASKELNNQKAVEYADEIEQHARSFLQSTAQTIADGLTEELREAIDALAQRIDDRGVVQGATIDAVRRAFAKIRDFSFAASPEILEKIRIVDDKLRDTNHQAINADSRHGDRGLSDDLVRTLRSLRQQSEADIDSFRRFGRATRSIEV